MSARARASESERQRERRGREELQELCVCVLCDVNVCDVTNIVICTTLHVLNTTPDLQIIKGACT